MEILSFVRDVAIIVLAIETIIVGLATLLLVLAAWKLVGSLRGHVDHLVSLTSDVLGTTADTARDVRGTTAFVADQTAKPLIELLSTITAATRFARAAFASGRGNGRDGN
jgi:hypothetical protein